MGSYTVQLPSRFAGGTYPMPPPPQDNEQAEKVFNLWLAWVNEHGIVDLAAKCAYNRATQVAHKRAGKSTSTWGNGSCFAVVEVLQRSGDSAAVVNFAGWSQSDTAAEGLIHAERSALSEAFNRLMNIEGVTRIYVELGPCTKKAKNQEDTCKEFVAKFAPNATIMFTHNYTTNGFNEFKRLNNDMAHKGSDLYGVHTDFTNDGHVQLHVDDKGSYVRWQGKNRAQYHKKARQLMTELEESDDATVPLMAAARVDGT